MYVCMYVCMYLSIYLFIYLRMPFVQVVNYPVWFKIFTEKMTGIIFRAILKKYLFLEVLQNFSEEPFVQRTSTQLFLS